MIKTYKLTARMNNAHIVLEGKSGNKVIYDFTDGNVITNTPARIVLYSKYDQDLLEDSEAFKAKMIVLEKSEKTLEDVLAEQKATHIEDVEEEVADGEDVAVEEEGEAVEKNVTTVTEAINFIAEKYGEVVKTARQAKEVAKAHGVEFPNLKVGRGK